MTGLSLRACGAKWRTQFNDYLMAVNSSCDVLVKIVEKLRGQHLHTGRGPGPTLILAMCYKAHN